MHINLEDLKDEVLTHIDTNEDNTEIMLTTKSGHEVRIYHDQDCCEKVLIEDTEGEWHTLLGKPILEATHVENHKEGDPPNTLDYGDESWTRTLLTFKIDGATVISKWVGSSNGYYSESVNIEQITGKM